MKFHIVNLCTNAVANSTLVNNHNQRLVEVPNVDPELTIHNVNSGRCDQAHIDQIIEYYELKPEVGKPKGFETILSLLPVNHDGTERPPKEIELKSTELLEHAMKWAKKYYSGNALIAGIWLHNDEYRPHIHIYAISYDSNKKLNSQIYKTKSKQCEARHSFLEYSCEVMPDKHFIDNPKLPEQKEISLAQRRTGLRPYAHLELNKAAVSIYLDQRYTLRMLKQAGTLESKNADLEAALERTVSMIKEKQAILHEKERKAIEPKYPDMDMDMDI